MNTPEPLHLALNHLPFLGAGFALIPLAIGFFTRNRNAVLSGLIIATLSGWMTPLVMQTGEAAYERYEEGPVATYLDPQAEAFLESHEDRAESLSKVMYASALISTICLGLLMWKATWIRTAASISVIFCIASLFSGIWIAESGGLIRRPDFRVGATTGQPPTSNHENERRDNDD